MCSTLSTFASLRISNRTNNSVFVAVGGEEIRLTQIIEETQLKINANAVSTKAMLQYIITLSELVQNNLAQYFPFALDSEKRGIALKVFSELKICDGNLTYVATPSFSALAERFEDRFTALGSEVWTYIEP